jgi:quaternary ammonium compound-resistance protein SugE
MALGWQYLIAAGLCEIGFAVLLKYSDGFTRLWPTLGFLIFGLISFFFLTRAMRTIPVGTAYAVWSGIGAAGTVILGVILFAEQLSLLRLAFLTLLIGAIFGLKFVSDS